ncbi:hypothetical protein [Jiulongibacter sediminis]|uniref:hypothetical protein n=1 Tax=Jiulongibacter sediminis TaxID=1605367 RepID=UPI00103927A2|nr:hypothetical protein [Jiulongibacter sediminis]
MSRRKPISLSCSSASCPSHTVPASDFVAVSPYAYQRHMRKANRIKPHKRGVRVYRIPCGCSLWVYQSGERFLSALPF